MRFVQRRSITTLLAGTSLTGPMSPDGCSGESFFHKRQLVKV